MIDADTAPENPVTPKKTALEVLENRGFKNAKIKKPCVTADYASDNVHIDLIIYKRSGEQHYLAVGKKNSDENNREWAIADPLGLMEWDRLTSVTTTTKRRKTCATSSVGWCATSSAGATCSSAKRSAPRYSRSD